MRYKKATKLAAPEYVEALMNWAQGLLDNEEIFPSEMGACSLALSPSMSRKGAKRPVLTLNTCRQAVRKELPRDDWTAV